MGNSLRIAVLLVAIVIFLINLQLLRRGRIPIKFSLLWLFVTLLLGFVAIVPNILIYFMNIIGFQTLSNMIVGMLFVVLFFITMALTVIVSDQNTKIKLLIQELSLLKEKINVKAPTEDEKE